MSLETRDSATHVYFSCGESIGLVLNGEVGVLSALAAAWMLVLIFVSTVSPFYLIFSFFI
jgi:hypothetical protein